MIVQRSSVDDWLVWFCIPTKAASVPTGPDWLHEIEYDGYRLRLERDGDSLQA